MKRILMFILCTVLAAALLGGCSAAVQKEAEPYSLVICVDQSGDPVAGVVLQVCTDVSCRLLTADNEGTVRIDSEVKDADIEVHSVPDGYILPEKEVLQLKEDRLTITIQKEEKDMESSETAAFFVDDDAEKLVFTTTDLDGNAVDESMLEGYELVFVNVWEPWCGPCLEEISEIENTYEALKDKGILFVGVTNLAPEPGLDPRDTVQEKGITYPVINFTEDFLFIVDEDGMVNLPTSFFVGKDGKNVILTDEEMSLLLCNFFRELQKQSEEAGDAESAEYYGGLLNMPLVPKERIDESRGKEGSYTISCQTQEALTAVIESILNRQ